jgi:acetoin utilization deacetylase AcuC-like enzyme
MTTVYCTHPVCAEHEPGPHHPENPDRLRAINRVLEGPDFSGLERRTAPLAARPLVALAHPEAFVDFVLENIPASGYRAFDADTIVSPRSGEAALHAVGAVTAAVDAVIAGEANNAFCGVRPPGHHAEPTRAMGFCLFNSVAVGAQHARHAHGLRRVAVVDFDVHHGNGTQAMFWDDPDLFYASTHQMPFYPGTGSPDEKGAHDNIVNAPLRSGSGSAEFRRAMQEIVLPRLLAFAPELLFVSAGFDAHRDDPLAGLMLEDEDYAWVTEELAAVAEEVCEGRLVSTLEGGYDLGALARSCAAHVGALMARG